MGALIVSAALLASAHAFEAAGYDPCLLCLRQREIHWAAIGVALIGLAANRFWPDERIVNATNALLAAIFLTSVAVAGYHAGVEYGFWPGPAACSAGAAAGLTGADILAALDAPIDAPSCSEAPWAMLGVSMAGLNALASLALLALSVNAAFLIHWRRSASYV